MRNNMFTYLIYINFSPIPIALKPDQFFFQMISVEQQKLDQTTAEWPSNWIFGVQHAFKKTVTNKYASKYEY